MIRFRFVDDHRTEYSVKRMCTVLNINRSSYYKWKATKPRRQRRQVADALLGVKVKTIFEEKDQLYGAKRIAAELNYSDKYPDNDPVNHKRIARIMRMLRLRGYTKKRKVTTTRSARNRKVFADLVKRNFTAPGVGPHPLAWLSFNVSQMNSTEKRIRYSSMNWIISDVER